MVTRHCHHYCEILERLSIRYVQTFVKLLFSIYIWRSTNYVSNCRTITTTPNSSTTYNTNNVLLVWFITVIIISVL